MAELALLGAVANLEGIKKCKPATSAEGGILNGLEARVRSLEAQVRITSPPPIDEPSWTSLAWRVQRLRLRSGGRAKDRPTFEQFMPKPTAVTLEALRNTIIKIPHTAMRQMLDIILDGNCADEGLPLGAVLQGLCFAAGWHGFKLDPIPVELAEIYAMAVDISIETEQSQLRPVPRSYPAGWPAPGTKGCCGCCSCSCHNKAAGGFTVPTIVDIPRRPLSRTSSISSRPASRWKGGFNWFRSLFCSRRPKRLTDYSSSSSESLTIIDI